MGNRHGVKGRSGIGHGRIKINKLAVEFPRQIEGLLHGLVIVVGQAEDEVADDVDAGFLDFADDGDNIILGERLFGAVAHVLGPGLDPQRQPADAGAFEFIQYPGLDRIDPGIGPDVQAVIAFDQKIANGVHVAVVEHEHLIDDLKGLDAVGVVQQGDFIDHRPGIAHAVTVDIERRVDAAKHAFVGTPQGRIDGCIGLARV